ncbi:uncharacterized protein G6M90_00g092020 [Metarhizium brunneum]|uniref:Uncharacterized protein n=1 Tax=Metarhizium brunneum TaxID=500148 RepID=A0A7D5Z9P2_9HYPO
MAQSTIRGFAKGVLRNIMGNQPQRSPLPQIMGDLPMGWGRQRQTNQGILREISKQPPGGDICSISGAISVKGQLTAQHGSTVEYRTRNRNMSTQFTAKDGAGSGFSGAVGASGS